MHQPLSFAITSDGSKTLFNSLIGEHYHSRHGALQESKHVFLESGLKHFLKHGKEKARILEVGFGTGLNFLVSAEHCVLNKIELDYVGIEAYPLSHEILSNTDYGKYFDDDLWEGFIDHYELALRQETQLDTYCKLRVANTTLLEFKSLKLFDLVYFDAFAAVHQPEMWNYEALSHISTFLCPGGVFVTYAITGDLKRTMKGLGFLIEKVPGAPGKREMLRATKL